MVQVDLRVLIRQERERRKQQSEASTSSRRNSDTEEQDLALLREGTAENAALGWTRWRIGNEIVKGLTYVPNFLSPSEAAAVVRWIESTPVGRWTKAGERRMQNWGGKPGTSEIVEELPSILQCLVGRLVTSGLYAKKEAPNHVLINEYASGAGIPPHQDGPLYLDRVATITLEGPALLHMHRLETMQTLTTVLLTPGCLFVADGPAYSECLHSIPTQEQDLIPAACCNAALAGVSAGDVSHRARRRFSLVFVHKLQPA